MAIERACHLLEKYADGKVLSDTIVHDKVEKITKVASVKLEDVNTVLGLSMTLEDVKHSLDNLGFNYEYKNDEFVVEIPNRRLDVEAHKQDLIEEIGRLYGYHNLVSTLPKVSLRRGQYIGDVKYRKHKKKYWYLSRI